MTKLLDWLLEIPIILFLAAFVVLVYLTIYPAIMLYAALFDRQLLRIELQWIKLRWRCRRQRWLNFKARRWLWTHRAVRP